MSAFSRTKGAAAERELINLLRNKFRGHTFTRNLQQSFRGGYDILTSIDWLAIEVKRCETLKLNEWLEQAKRQAKPWQIPVLAYRQNRKPWMFIFDGNEGNLISFVDWVNFELNKRKENE